jgi:hypothetical protein
VAATLKEATAHPSGAGARWKDSTTACHYDPIAFEAHEVGVEGYGCSGSEAGGSQAGGSGAAGSQVGGSGAGGSSKTGSGVGRAGGPTGSSPPCSAGQSLHSPLADALSVQVQVAATQPLPALPEPPVQMQPHSPEDDIFDLNASDSDGW